MKAVTPPIARATTSHLLGMSMLAGRRWPLPSSGKRGDNQVLQLMADWRQVPDVPHSDDPRELEKSLLRVQTRLGLMASVHLDKVRFYPGGELNVACGRMAYRWLFDAHDLVMGDMNIRHDQMVSDNGMVRASDSQHTCAKLSPGSYLPGLTEPAKDFRGRPKACMPQSWDLVVTKRPVVAELSPKQRGKRLTKSWEPRALMCSLRWPSGHTSVLASVSSHTHDGTSQVAT